MAERLNAWIEVLTDTLRRLLSQLRNDQRMDGEALRETFQQIAHVANAGGLLSHSMRRFLSRCEKMRATHAFLRPGEPVAEFFSLFDDGLAAIRTANDGVGAYVIVDAEELMTLLRPLRGRRP